MTWSELEKLALATMEHAFDQKPIYSTEDLKNLAVIAGIAHDKVKYQRDQARDRIEYLL